MTLADIDCSLDPDSCGTSISQPISCSQIWVSPCISSWKTSIFAFVFLCYMTSVRTHALKYKTVKSWHPKYCHNMFCMSQNPRHCTQSLKGWVGRNQIYNLYHPSLNKIWPSKHSYSYQNSILIQFR